MLCIDLKNVDINNNPVATKPHAKSWTFISLEEKYKVFSFFY